MKKILALLICLSLIILVLQLGAAEQQTAVVRIGSLKGPTSMGLVKLMRDHDGDSGYEFTVAGAADEITPLIARGELDIALIPANLASVLNSKLEGKLEITAINTLGVLYVVEIGNEINVIEDLRGKTMLSMGKGTTPEYALNYVLGKNGLNPETDLDIDYRSEATEVASALGSGLATVAMLPQPYVTAVMAQNPDMRVALSLTDEWEKVSPDSALITGVVVMRKEFAQQNPDAAKAFMDEYRKSTEYVNSNPAEVAPWIEELGIAKAQVAEAAIPACNIVCITGDEMAQKVAGYLGALYQQNPASVGGKLPDEAFYNKTF